MKTEKIVLTVLSILSFLSVAFWAATYFLGGLSHLYYSQEVVHRIYGFFAISILVLSILISIIVMMFKSKKTVESICIVLLTAFILLALFGSFPEALFFSTIGPNGCSYTEDIANYGKYDKEYVIPYFPQEITEDMTVVQFAYFYKYRDIDQVDIYLEVKFEDRETMDTYLTKAKNSLCEEGNITYQNPYDPKYTDIIPKRAVLYSSQNGVLASYIDFDGSEDYKYVDVVYRSVTYSYDDLTVIYNYTDIGSDIEVGNSPDNGKYYPKFLERFDVEWSPDNTFMYEYVEE